MWCALLMGSGTARGAAIYEAGVTVDLSTLTVEARFTAPVPRVLEAQDPSAGKYLEGLRVSGARSRLPAAGAGRIALGPSGDSLVVNYTVDLRAIERAGRFRRTGSARTHAVLSNPQLWLWLPPSGESQAIKLRFRLPDGMSVSGPWPQGTDSDGFPVFDVGELSQDWPALVAIGRFEVRPVEVPGAQLRLAVLDGNPAPDPAAIRDWIAGGAAAVAGAYGAFPLNAPQILVVPLGRGDEPVPWGQVLRGGGAAAHLFIDQTRPAAELRNDWVLVHELSHMLHPNLDGKGPWLAEGMATYYQNVLRARAGMLTGAQAWQKLHEGFQRGIAGTQAGVTLDEATRNMMENHLFMRVYWSGAAMVLLADLQLRRRGQSLDRVLSRFRDCCLDQPRVWLVAEYLGTLDRLAEAPVFMPLYRRYADSDQFPDLSAAYAELGLGVRGGKVVPGVDAEAAALRQAIMGDSAD